MKNTSIKRKHFLFYYLKEKAILNSANHYDDA